MDDLRHVQSSALDMTDPADQAEYHRLLDRFADEEAAENRKRLLYDGARFGATVRGARPE
jgi:hypothetical protein